MLILYLVLALAIVFGIAAIVVGREARRLDLEPPKAVFDLEEATEWVANHLPFEVSAVLSFGDVRQIIEWNLEFLRDRGLAQSGGAPSADGDVVVGAEELADFVLDRAREHDSPYSEEQVVAVLDAQFSYLDAISAIGPEATPDELGN
ncbi:MAG: hypothetical protein NVS3B21_23180 [Acidimicrobiales bacterium]